MSKTVLLLFILLPFSLFSQSGKDGAETVTTAVVIFNRYTTLAASASTGNTSVTVSNIANLSSAAIAGAANNPYATASLGYGDLIMIIKMQGATINTGNTSGYGAVTAANNTGIYELKVVRGVAGNVISFCGGLVNNYTIGGTQRVQVIRIPRLSALTVNAAASITASAWSGSFTGGIVALEVTGNAAVNGSITVTGLGFRGGVVDNNTSGAPGGPTNYVNAASTDGAEKGESIAGFQGDYDGLNGRYDRGAPANGGGGGNAHNAGGGGGANGNNGNAWTGQGVMIVNGSNPLAAWQQDPGYTANGNALTNSSGGGRGGYTYGSSNQVATTVAPGNAAWGGDNRREAGGLGGRPLAYASNLLYLGGGGGAGDGNNTAAQNGANGGGIIYLHVTGNLSGTGAVTANGAAAGPTIGGHNDAPGGGGGGGAIRLNIQGTITGVTITANGGAGGNQLITSDESEGPGGGGGGGYIQTTGTPTLSVAGGSNGTTSSNAVTEFTANGATTGASGGTLTGQAFVAAPALTCFALPVTLVSFDARLNTQQQGLLSWVTENETNIESYHIEASTDGLQWQTIQTLPANNLLDRQTYTITTSVVNKTTHFRLKILNNDQSFTYSSIKQLLVPVKTNIIVRADQVLLTGIAPGAKAVVLFSGNGSRLYEQQLTGQASITISNPSFAAGMYYLKIYHVSGREEVVKFVKP